MRLSKIPCIADLQKDTPEGCCCFCQEPIPGYAEFRMKPVRCKGLECQASYHRIYGEYRRTRNVSRGFTAGGHVPKNPKDPRLGTRRVQWSA